MIFSLRILMWIKQAGVLDDMLWIMTYVATPKIFLISCFVLTQIIIANVMMLDKEHAACKWLLWTCYIINVLYHFEWFMIGFDNFWPDGKFMPQVMSGFWEPFGQSWPSSAESGPPGKVKEAVSGDSDCKPCHMIMTHGVSSALSISNLISYQYYYY